MDNEFKLPDISWQHPAGTETVYVSGFVTTRLKVNTLLLVDVKPDIVPPDIVISDEVKPVTVSPKSTVQGIVPTFVGELNEHDTDGTGTVPSYATDKLEEAILAFNAKSVKVLSATLSEIKPSVMGVTSNVYVDELTDVKPLKVAPDTVISPIAKVLVASLTFAVTINGD